VLPRRYALGAAWVASGGPLLGPGDRPIARSAAGSGRHGPSVRERPGRKRCQATAGIARWLLAQFAEAGRLLSLADTWQCD